MEGDLRRLLEIYRGVPKGLVIYDPAADDLRYAAITLAGARMIWCCPPSGLRAFRGGTSPRWRTSKGSTCSR